MSKLRIKKSTKQKQKTSQKDPFIILSALKEAAQKYCEDLNTEAVLFPKIGKSIRLKKLNENNKKEI